MRAMMQCFQNALAYLTAAVSCAHKMLMKSAREPMGGAPQSDPLEVW